MNKKAQVVGVGAIILTFVAILVGISLFNGGITSNVAGVTDTQIVNESFTTPAAGLESNLQGKLVTGFVAYNSTGVEAQTGFNGTGFIDAGNYTITNNKIVSGELTAVYNTSVNGYVGELNVTYTTQPDGYITSAGGRALASLIIVFAALAIAILAMMPVLKSGLDGMFGR